jgi:hypothetical protein
MTFVCGCIPLNAAEPSENVGTAVGAQALSVGYSGRFDAASESILSVHGDSWAVAWCDNDLQYVVSDDSKNVDGSCVNSSNSKGYNITFGQLTTPSPTSQLAGSAINCMSEYGTENETAASRVSSNSCRATWKATGNVCIGSTLYMGISRQVYSWNGFGNTGDHCYADRQKAFDGSLIHSTDGGANWSVYPGLDAGGPGVQFPGSSFGTPSFIQYGKGMNDWLPLDGARDYVYATSNDGYWNNGNQLFLARALRGSDLMSKVNWEYLTNASPPRWGPLPEVLNSDPSFESVSGDGSLLDWPIYGTASAVTNNPTAGNQTHWGGHSLVMYGSSDGTYRTIGRLNPGSTYYVSGYMRVTNIRETVLIGVKNYGGPELKAASSSLDWDRKVVSFAPAGSSADIYCWKENGTQAAFCDDVQLTQQQPPAAVLEAPGDVSVTQIQYLPPSNGAPGLYLMPEWYYPDPNTVCNTRWAFYIAEVPWGPWTKLDVGDDGPDAMEKEWSDCSARTNGYYNPTVVSKWIGEYDQASHERDVWLLYSGDFSSDIAYKPHLMRMVVTYPSVTSNILLNGSFENGDGGWWKSATAAVVADRPYRGSNSARVSSNDGFVQVISGLTPGATYQLSGYLRVTAAGDDLRIGVKDYGGPELSARGTSLDYTQGIIDFTPTSTSATIYCWKWTGSSYAYCDGIQVSKR